MHKKRILFVTEATYLSTGYATYSKEVMNRVFNTGKYEIAELSCYGTEDDPRRKSIKWKNYPNIPSKDEQRKAYESNPINQFGAWRFEATCFDFKPDIVVSITDFWMCSYIKSSPFRRMFNWCWMPTVDADGQNSEWIEYMANADAVTTYCDWSFDLLKKYSNKIKLACSTPPCASPVFSPVADKKKHKADIGLNPEWKIIGTVMRNQRRKLFPELFESFSKFLKQTGRKDVYLHCHTSYPDNGWDFPKLMMDNNISSRVLFTYVCDSCKKVSVSHFGDSLKVCDHCKNLSCKPTSVSSGVDTEVLAQIYNTFDLYVQCANSEGFGIGQVEAASCGVPVASTDYSAMSDIVRKLNGFPIMVQSLYEELETGCYRAKPDTDYMTLVFKTFFEMSDREIEECNTKALEGCKTHYSWDVTSEKWCRLFDSLESPGWNQQIVKTKIPSSIPENLNNKQFIDWVLSSLLPEMNLVGSYESNSLLRDLNFNSYKNLPCGFFYSENSYMGRENYVLFTREILFEMVKRKAQSRNFWEDARSGAIKLNRESWLD